MMVFTLPIRPLLSVDVFHCLHSDGGKSRPWLGTEGSPQREDPQQRLRWQAHLEFTHNHTVGDLTWELIDPVLPRSERLHSLVLGAIPHSMRPQVIGLARQGRLLVDSDWNGLAKTARLLLSLA